MGVVSLEVAAGVNASTAAVAQSVVQEMLLSKVTELVGNARLGNTCHACFDGCRPPVWDLAQYIALTGAWEFLGASRCSSLRSSCRSWSHTLRAAAPKRRLAMYRDAKIDPSTLVLRTLGAPTFTSQPTLALEDDLYCILGDPKNSANVTALINAHTNISDYSDIGNAVTSLRTMCKISADVVSVVFQPQLEREKTLFMFPRPIHYAVVHASSRIVSMLLAIASKAECLEKMLQLENQDHLAPSPLFFAILFGDQSVVDVLVRAGSRPNEIDIRAAARLQRAGLWNVVQDRMAALGIEETSSQLESGLRDMRDQAIKARAAIRAALRG